MKCNVCGLEFTPKKEDRYVATKTECRLIGGIATTMHDCFDCPECGCQIVAQERLDRIENIICCGTEQNTDPCD